jgi:hypothetical protein
MGSAGGALPRRKGSQQAVEIKFIRIGVIRSVDELPLYLILS